MAEVCSLLIAWKQNDETRSTLSLELYNVTHGQPLPLVCIWCFIARATLI